MNAAGHNLLMDRIYRHQRHFYDLTRRPYLFGRDTLIRRLNATAGERILEIGCGTARNLVKIAQSYPGTLLWGIDASAEMLRTANRAVSRANLSSRVVLLHGLAEDAMTLLPQPNPRFDHVIFSYSLSMISDWKAALIAAQTMLSESGQLHVVDFGDLNGLDRATAGLLRAWLHLFHVHPRTELLHQAEAVVQNRPECGLKILFGRYAFVFEARSSALDEIAASGML
jgi:S-adenosylmethionine-diacylgycerolhomoserine-N-methlytransferase